MRVEVKQLKLTVIKKWTARWQFWKIETYL